MSRDARDGPGVVLEQMRLHARRLGGRNVDCDIVDEQAGFRPHTPPLEAALRVPWPHVVRSPHQRRAALSLDACARELVFIGGPLLVLAPHTLTGTTVVLIATAAIVLAGCALFLTAPPAAPHVEAVLHPHALARPDPYPWSARPGGSPVRGGHHPGSTQRRRPRRRRTSPRRVPLDDDARGARRRQPDRRPPLRTPHLARYADASTPHARLRLCGRLPADACRPRPCPGHHGRRTARPLPRAAAGDGLPHAGLPRPPPTLGLAHRLSGPGTGRWDRTRGARASGHCSRGSRRCCRRRGRSRVRRAAATSPLLPTALRWRLLSRAADQTMREVSQPPPHKGWGRLRRAWIPGAPERALNPVDLTRSLRVGISYDLSSSGLDGQHLWLTWPYCSVPQRG